MAVLKDKKGRGDVSQSLEMIMSAENIQYFNKSSEWQFSLDRLSDLDSFKSIKELVPFTAD